MARLPMHAAAPARAAPWRSRGLVQRGPGAKEQLGVLLQRHGPCLRLCWDPAGEADQKATKNTVAQNSGARVTQIVFGSMYTGGHFGKSV